MSLTTTREGGRMAVDLLLIFAFLAAGVPAVLFLWNLVYYKPAKKGAESLSRGLVSVLIPARNEERCIDAAIQSVLRNRGVSLELIVLDDGSTDATPRILQDWVGRESRLRALSATSLPEGWGGKPHACHRLASHASGEWLLFIDADVQLSEEAVRRVVDHATRERLDLLSGVPRQITGSFLEKLLIPLIHFVLLGFLPFVGMRHTRRASFSAGCGQFFLVRREAYWAAGGHSAIRDSLHDGIDLPRAFRLAGFRTDLVDLTDLAVCRMYRDNLETWRGLSKNATAGLGAPQRIVPATILLWMGQVMPWLLMAWLLLTPASGVQRMLSVGVTLLSMLPRLLGSWRYRQSFLGVSLHPLSVLLLLAIQWMALLRYAVGRPVEWKGRRYFKSASPDRPQQPRAPLRSSVVSSMGE